MTATLLAISLLLSSNYDPSLLGTWKYNFYEYRGQVQPAPNPNLDLRFTFDDNGDANLKWHYEDPASFCERTAHYEILPDNWLHQKVTWLNPKNNLSCGSDPDMQMDGESYSHYRIQGDQLFFELEINGEPLIYIFDKTK